jgi:predicted ABC-type ATPase
MNKYLSQGETFAIETNLADLDTWKFLIEIQKTGYHIELIYLSTDHIKILNSRIEQRALSGEHFVRPDIVEEQYTNSLSLLNHYLPVPDVVFL